MKILIERSTKEFEKNILDNLSSIGLTPDENPINQSERNEIYLKAAEKIIESGKAYWCDCSPEDCLLYTSDAADD